MASWRQRARVILDYASLLVFDPNRTSRSWNRDSTRLLGKTRDVVEPFNGFPTCSSVPHTEAYVRSAPFRDRSSRPAPMNTEKSVRVRNTRIPRATVSSRRREWWTLTSAQMTWRPSDLMQNENPRFILRASFNFAPEHSRDSRLRTRRCRAFVAQKKLLYALSYCGSFKERDEY